MDSALWLLLWLRLRGWFRRILRNAHTVRGMLLLIVGSLFFCCMCIQPAMLYFTKEAGGPAPGSVQNVRAFGPLGLFLYCVLTLVFSSGERGITFVPAEVDLLFPAPISRRQLLLYKVWVAFFSCLAMAIFMTVFLAASGVWLLAAYVGLVLTFMFLTLFGMSVSLIGNTIGMRAYTLGRRALVAVLLAVVVLGLLQLGRSLFDFDYSTPEGWEQLQKAPAIQVVFAPLSWFAGTVAATTWLDLAQYGALSLLVNAVMLGLVLVLDAQYLEASAATAERIYAQMQRVRSGGALAVWRNPAKPVKFTLPMPPSWGGAGPVAWRQAVTAFRNMRGLLFFLVIFSTALVIPMAITSGSPKEEQVMIGRSLLATLLAMSLISLPTMLTYDFRGDVDRMDVLKTLPIPTWGLVVGQLVTPVLVLGMVQLALMLTVQFIFGGLEEFLLAAFVLIWPVGFISFEVDNLLFLIFPARIMPQTAGDVQSMGRQMLVFAAKGIALFLAGGFAALAGGIVYLITESWIPTVAVAWVVLLGFAIGLVPFLAMAFRNFDVARDTPA